MTADGLVWDERPALRRPVLLAAFRGWNDAANAASDAAVWLRSRLGGRRFAHVDAEAHFDFQGVRPAVELVDGVTRSIVWPSNECFATDVAREGASSAHDLVILVGTEPNYAWRSFCRAVLTVVRETGCELVITLGALLADVPHTRPCPLTGTATDDALVHRLDLTRSRYEGPTGIVGVLHDACQRAGVPSASLWASVPHYLAGPPHPGATQLLVERVAALVGLGVDTSDLQRAETAWRRHIDALTGEGEVAEHVRALEERYDAVAGETRDLPSGDDLAEELEQFLRHHRDDPEAGA